MPRQKLIGYFFGVLALFGLAMYLLFPAGSEWRLLGIVLLIFCLPISLRFGFRQAKAPALSPRAPAPAPASAPVFRPREVNLTVEAAFTQIVPTSLMLPDNDILDLPCLLAIGSDGFRARLWRADKITGPWPNDEKLVLNAEFLMPERALPSFPIGTAARVLVGRSVIGNVKVLRHHSDENPAPADAAQPF